jgi:4-amino-4-deoxy-L-arabinose transferase-like glycosyltransferase
LAAVAAFTVLILAPFWGKAWHVDEPFFLAIARHILADFRHPLAFDFNWYGRSVPMPEINNTPPLLAYLLAGAWKATGGREWAMRLCFLPLDLLAAFALYLLAARFLRRPLLPVLVLLAAPAYFISMGHLMAEKPAAAFAFAGLYFLVRSLDDPARPKAGRDYWFSALLVGAALGSKYAAVFALPPALAAPWST